MAYGENKGNRNYIGIINSYMTAGSTIYFKVGSDVANFPSAQYDILLQVYDL
jgi:N-acetylmuramoyl-L-alanine amidase CwlA